MVWYCIKKVKKSWSVYTYNLKLVYDAFDFILIKVLNGWGVSTRALEGVIHCIAMFLSLVWYVEDKIDLKFQLEVSRVQDSWILKEENKKIRSHYIFAKNTTANVPWLCQKLIENIDLISDMTLPIGSGKKWLFDPDMFFQVVFSRKLKERVSNNFFECNVS